MRILHLIKSFNFGGAENHVRDLANVMCGMGNDVFIIAKKGNQNSLLNKGVHFTSIRMQDFMIIFHILYLVYFIRRNKIQVMHAHQRLPILIASLAGWITGVPVVVTVHGQTQYDLRSVISKKIPERFIFVRQRTIDDSIEYGIPAEKSLVIQNGAQIIDPLTGRDLYSLCYISRIDKRHSSLIRKIIQEIVVPVSEEFPETTFNVVGDGEYLADLKSEAEKINSQLKREIIKIHGYLPDVKDIIKKSGLVMGVGRVAIESLACGVPLLSVNQKFLGGLVSQDNYTFYRKDNFVSRGSDPPNSKTLLASLREYLSDVNFWQKEALILHKKIDEDFNIFKIVGSITDLYRELLKQQN
jgi:glycosyltransferase involved in cell wall biosynthesis